MYVNALHHALRAIRLRDAEFVNLEVTAMQPVMIPSFTGANPDRPSSPGRALFCHLVTEGECVIISKERSEIRLRAGDVIALTNGASHSLQAIVCNPRPSGGRHIDRASRTKFICGTFVWENDPFGPLMAALPEIIRCPKSRGVTGSSVSDFYLLCANEGKTECPREDAVLARLGEALFMKIIMAHFESVAVGRDGWLAGLRDRHVGQALSLLHARPDKSWTLDQLSREIGMSRSALADRFIRFIGTPPMHYLALWRMQLATSLMLSDKRCIAKIASDVGYESEAAFSRAFKKIIGVPPAAWRRSQHEIHERQRSDQSEPGRPVLSFARAS
jgi:AraC-like DNA-binding protein